MKLIINNAEFLTFVSKLKQSDKYWAIRLKGQLMIFDNKRTFTTRAKKYHDAVQGVINTNNFIYYSF